MIRTCRPKKPPALHALGSLQLSLLTCLWAHGESSVRELMARIVTPTGPDRGPAYVTLLTVLRRLERRGLLTHRVEGRRFIFRPLVSKERIQQAVLTEVVAPLCGQASALAAGAVAE